MKNSGINSIDKSRGKTSIFHRICHRLHYMMYSVLILGVLMLALVEGHRLEGLGLIALALIGFVVFDRLREVSAPEDTVDRDENGNAKANYR